MNDEATEHNWDEVSYELPRSGGCRMHVGWFCTDCGIYRSGDSVPDKHDARAAELRTLKTHRTELRAALAIVRNAPMIGGTIGERHIRLSDDEWAQICMVIERTEVKA